ncbi:unnamed protein product [Macrosiphum euphorbiae]|uniref:Uncharacterized protein n=1 Tax=Macrosiphum euphorbiae TaxID=13131 RepID=A0AAV0XYZ9_9HEMI|nr:unnamed protein product [Macrosiphum euphorbiae]
MRFPATAVSKMTVRQPSNCDRTHARVSMQRCCGVRRRARFLLKRKDGGRVYLEMTNEFCVDFGIEMMNEVKRNLEFDVLIAGVD